MGDSDFVAAVLRQAEEGFERKYELKRLGYDLGRVAARVAENMLAHPQFLTACAGPEARTIRLAS